MAEVGRRAVRRWRGRRGSGRPRRRGAGLPRSTWSAAVARQVGRWGGANARLWAAGFAGEVLEPHLARPRKPASHKRAAQSYTSLLVQRWTATGLRGAGPAAARLVPASRGGALPVRPAREGLRAERACAERDRPAESCEGPALCRSSSCALICSRVSGCGELHDEMRDEAAPG